VVALRLHRFRLLYYRRCCLHAAGLIRSTASP
jgi:hypothetical protein